MDATKLTISPETMEAANKPLNKQKRGELRMEKLKRLAESGRLAMIKTRGDLAEAVGYPYSQRATLGYQWVHYRVKKGILKETLVGYNKGTPEYEYEYIDPDTMTNKKVQTEVLKPGEGYTISFNADMDQEAKVIASQTITIYKGETTIAVENATTETITNIIKEIFKGE